MTIETQSYPTEEKTFRVRGTYSNGKDRTEPIGRNYTAQNRLEAVKKAKEDGLEIYLSTEDITPKIITKVKGMVLYGN